MHLGIDRLHIFAVFTHLGVNRLNIFAVLTHLGVNYLYVFAVFHTSISMLNCLDI